MTQWMVTQKCMYCDKNVHISKRKDFHDACYKKAVRVGKSILKGKRRIG